MDWLRTLSKLAPTIASVLGGPFSGLAVSFIGNALGVSQPTVQSVKDAIEKSQMTGDQIVAIKQAEIAFQQHLSDHDLTLEQLSVQNTEGARQMQSSTRSLVPALLAMVVTVGFFLILTNMMTGYYKPADNQALLIMLGALGASWGAIINFYFGSSHGSQIKDEYAAMKASK